jgi:hypothetical protein
MDRFIMHRAGRFSNQLQQGTEVMVNRIDTPCINGCFLLPGALLKMTKATGLEG